MTEIKRASLVKPTKDTRFHIDFDWWTKNDRDWRVYLISNLCPEHQKLFSGSDADEKIDWIDPKTAEVQELDGLQHVLISHCAKQPGFISEGVPVVDSIFRIFLANGNIPLSCQQLSEHLNRQPDTILKVLTGMRIYKGLRPVLD